MSFFRSIFPLEIDNSLLVVEFIEESAESFEKQNFSTFKQSSALIAMLQDFAFSPLQIFGKKDLALLKSISSGVIKTKLLFSLL